jgi:hypothetical protein
MRRGWVALLMGIGLLVASLALRHAAPAANTSLPIARPPPPTVGAAPTVRLATPPTADAFRARLEELAARLAAAQQPVRLRSSQLLARVNGAAIAGSDLVPWRDHDAEQSLSRPMFVFLLDRAIERELVSQAARARGIALTEEQTRQLEQLRAARDPAQAEFDVRDTAGKLLLATLAAREGVPDPLPGPADVEAYYREHQEELGAPPDDPEAHAAAWQQLEIEIRKTLSQERQAAYKEGVQQLIGELKAAAAVSAG